MRLMYNPEAARLHQCRVPAFVDTAAGGHLLTTPLGLEHFLGSARAVNAEVIVLDPLCSAHDQDENDTRAMSALCQSLLRLRDGSGAALIIIHLSRVVRYASVAVQKRESE